MVVALAMAAAGVAPVVAPVKNAGNQSKGRGAVRVPRQQGAGRVGVQGSSGRDRPAVDKARPVLTKVHEAHVLLRGPPYPQGPAPGSLDLPEQGPAHVGCPEGCGYRGGGTEHSGVPCSNPRTPPPPGRDKVDGSLGSKCTSTMARTELPGPKSRRRTLQKSFLTSEFRKRSSSCER